MALKVVWTEKASGDMRSIYDYISRDSVTNADRSSDRIIHAADEASERPLAGRMVPEIGQKTVREVILGSYRIVYRIKRGTIQILRVSHSARLLKL